MDEVHNSGLCQNMNYFFKAEVENNLDIVDLSLFSNPQVWYAKTRQAFM